MTPSQEKVLAVLKLMKPEWKWAAYSPHLRFGTFESIGWKLFMDKPLPEELGLWFADDPDSCMWAPEIFDLPPFEGNWEDSLVERRD